MPYTLYRDLTGGGALIKQVSHWDTNLFSGAKLDPDFETPVVFRIDLHTEGRRMPTLFMVPAFVARKAFYEALLVSGVDNIDAYPAIIRNTETKEEFGEYLFLNIVGRVECANMTASDYNEIGPGINLIDQVVIDGAKLPTMHIFRLAEDALKVVISDEVHQRLQEAGFDDVFYRPVIVR